ncbi:MAG: hypothetical protein F6J87_27310 [Spirulina sp. SIO3F2]|nr:hypothetical protein [Spirulina sp. SIO3F2]
MSTIDLALQHTNFPLMMRLAIQPLHDVDEIDFHYDGEKQISSMTSMSGSWCTKSSSTWKTFSPNDSDQQEDD